MDAVHHNEDWKVVTQNNDVRISTARRWISKGTPTELPRGGTKNIKILEEHKAAIVNYIEENSPFTLKRIKEKLMANYNLNVSVSAIDKHCDGMMFTFKKIHEQPITMNSEENKVKRREYVAKLMQFSGEGKFIVYIDETKRCYGRSKTGI